MRTTAFRLAALAAACAATLSVHAAPTSVSAGQVTIGYDSDTFNFWREPYVGGYDTIDPNSVSYNLLANGIEVNFNGLMGLSASSYTYYSSETLSAGFDAAFAFTPDAGYAITGYTVTFSGGYFVESPGSVQLSATGTGFYDAGTGSAFNLSAFIGGPAAPSLTGSMQATGDVSYIEIFDGYEEVVHCDDPNDPYNCWTEYIPIYHTEMDLGLAEMQLQKMTITAQVTAVPEPSIYALMGAGLGAVGLMVRRRKRGTAA